MNKYTTNGRRPVTAESMIEAAQVFADRAARSKFGRRGYARTCNQGAYAENGSLAEFSAFIGVTTPGNPHETTGYNINFTVYQVSQ